MLKVNFKEDAVDELELDKIKIRNLDKDSARAKTYSSIEKGVGAAGIAFCDKPGEASSYTDINGIEQKPNNYIIWIKPNVLEDKTTATITFIHEYLHCVVDENSGTFYYSKSNFNLADFMEKYNNNKDNPLFREIYEIIEGDFICHYGDSCSLTQLNAERYVELGARLVGRTYTNVPKEILDYYDEILNVSIVKLIAQDQTGIEREFYVGQVIYHVDSTGRIREEKILSVDFDKKEIIVESSEYYWSVYIFYVDKSDAEKESNRIKSGSNS